MKAKEVIRNVLHTVAVIVGFISFFLLVGTAGAIDQNNVDLETGSIRMLIAILVMAVSALAGSALDEGEEDDEFNNL